MGGFNGCCTVRVISICCLATSNHRCCCDSVRMLLTSSRSLRGQDLLPTVDAKCCPARARRVLNVVSPAWTAQYFALPNRPTPMIQQADTCKCTLIPVLVRIQSDLPVYLFECLNLTHRTLLSKATTTIDTLDLAPEIRLLVGNFSLRFCSFHSLWFFLQTAIEFTLLPVCVGRK